MAPTSPVTTTTAAVRDELAPEMNEEAVVTDELNLIL